MSTKIRNIALDKLVPHPDNPNRMSRANFGKLVHNIERTGRYEPLVVRPCPRRPGFFQIINGHHRCEALRKLGHQTADAVVWNVDDEQTDLLLATLNRLAGRDTLEKKLTVLRRLTAKMPTDRLARLLPQTRGQLERLLSARPLVLRTRPADEFAIPIVVFADPGQQRTIEEAILRAVPASSQGQTRAARRAAALTRVARCFLDQGKSVTEDEPAAPSAATVPA
ncbi:MAG: hypothetical protein A2Y77_12685 [Planctomycetes bacterium RBG_13_62_9]|nr:MAG: hypothetical protein A2Y77_12685 [Planctomycetes bacterium RBG_13_62_9]